MKPPVGTGSIAERQCHSFAISTHSSSLEELWSSGPFGFFQQQWGKSVSRNHTMSRSWIKSWKGSCVILAACLLYTGIAWGEACDVTTTSSSPQVPVVQGHTCYEFERMPPGTIDWSCSNEDRGSRPRQKRKVPACPEKPIASCSATLTQEALANEQSTSKEPGQATLDIPNDAKVITWYYDLPGAGSGPNRLRTGWGNIQLPVEIAGRHKACLCTPIGETGVRKPASCQRMRIGT